MADLSVLEQQAVADVVARLGMAVDQGDWPAARACFSEELDTDYTSLTGGEPSRIRADDLVAAWTAMLTPLDAIQHLLGPAVVDMDGETAVCRRSAQVTHVFGAERWVIGGWYRYRLERSAGGWVIAGAMFMLQWQEGDGGVMERAAAAAAS